MKNKQIIIAVIVLIIVAGISFYAGTKYSSGNRKNANGNFMMGTGNFGENGNARGAGFSAGTNGGARGGRGGMMGQNFVSGEIISKDATSITVKLKDGGSKIIFVNQNTKIQKIIDGSISDISIGSQITINGQSNADGSVNAISIQQRPTSL